MAEVDIKAEMLKVWENGQKEIEDLKAQIKEKQEKLKGAAAYLKATGIITPKKRKPRTPKE